MKGKTIIVDCPPNSKLSKSALMKYKRRQMGAKNVQKAVKKELTRRGLKKVEFKYKDEINNSAIATNTGIWASSHNFLNPISQGDGHADRDGFVIQPVGLQLKLTASCLDGVSCMVRILLVRWDGVLAPTSLDDFFTSWASALDCTTNLYNPEKREYFKVLMDTRFDISSLADSDGRKKIDRYFNLKNHRPVKYTNTTAVVDTDMTQGRYYLLYFATSPVTLLFSNRFKFTG